MKVFNKLEVGIDGDKKNIFFGIPDTKEELNAMYSLRYKVYSKKGYIDKVEFKEGMEVDEYDKENKCVYFIAKIDDKIIGTVRVISDDFLPTEKECFLFEEPDQIGKIPRNKRIEFGRLIAIPYDESRSIYLPRHVVMLFLFKSVITYLIDNKVMGGYAFIKNKLKEKLEKIKVPFHRIKKYEQVYSEKGILYNYFNQPDDKVIPIYFIVDELDGYIKKALNNRFMFTSTNKREFVLKNNFYNKLLKLIGVK